MNVAKLLPYHYTLSLILIIFERYSFQHHTTSRQCSVLFCKICRYRLQLMSINPISNIAVRT